MHPRLVPCVDGEALSALSLALSLTLSPLPLAPTSRLRARARARPPWPPLPNSLAATAPSPAAPLAPPPSMPMALRPPPQALGGAKTHRALAVAEAVVAGSVVLALLSCCCLQLGWPGPGASAAGYGQALACPLLAAAGLCPAGRARPARAVLCCITVM